MRDGLFFPPTSKHNGVNFVSISLKSRALKQLSDVACPILKRPPRRALALFRSAARKTVDSERILTELRTEGYEVVPRYDDADVVIVNTCGFIDSAVQESLEAIGEALNSNGKVIVTGCLGAKEDQIREVHPKVLEITGPHSYEQVLSHVHRYAPKPQHNPFLSTVPEQGVKLTPRHYAYLKISEGCNHRCTFCIIPSMRGDLDSRPIGEVLDEAKRLVSAGVKSCW